MSPGTEFARDFCAGIGPLQLGVVLVYNLFTLLYLVFRICFLNIDKKKMANTTASCNRPLLAQNIDEPQIPANRA